MPVYPTYNYEHRSLNLFETKLSLIDQSIPYANWIFFTSLANSYLGADGVKFMIDVLGKKAKATRLDQANALASFPSLDMHFHRFHSHYALAQIKDTSGETLPTTYPIQEVWDFSGLAKEEKKVWVEPFTFKNAKLNLSQGGIHSLTYEGSEKISASILKNSSAKEFDDFYTGYPISIDTSCQAKPKTALVIFSQADSGLKSHEATIVDQFEAQDCGCKVSSAPPPACWIGTFELESDSFCDFMNKAIAPNILETCRSSGRMTISKTGSVDYVPGDDNYIKASMPLDFSEHNLPPVIEYGPIVGRTDAHISVQSNSQVCFHSLESSIWAHVRIQLGDQVIKQGYPIDFVDPDGHVVEAKCTSGGVEFDKANGAVLKLRRKE
jgi:hypothetical protein